MMLTAGLGTRLRPVTEFYAKPAVPFLNVPLLYFPLPLIEEIGAHTLVLNTHYKPEQIEAIASKISRDNFQIQISPETTAPLGSGGGIWNARRFLDGDEFLVCNGDEVILPREPGIMKRFLAEHRASGAIATIMVMEHAGVGTQFGGVWADSTGHVRGFGKDGAKFGAGLAGYHYIGLLLLHGRIFGYLPAGESNILYDALTAAIQAGEKVKILNGNFTWFETGNPQDFLHASRAAMTLLTNGDGASGGEDARLLKKICSRFWSKGTRIETSPQCRLLIGAGARMNGEASGFVVLGDDSSIESGAKVIDSVLMPGAQLLKSSTTTSQIVLSR